MVRRTISISLPSRDLGDKDVALITDKRRENERSVVQQLTELQEWVQRWINKQDP